MAIRPSRASSAVGREHQEERAGKEVEASNAGKRPKMIQPIDYFLVVWFALAFASTAYVAWDQLPEQPRAGGHEVGLHPGHALYRSDGLLLYVLADKEPRPGEHETFIKPLWKQGAAQRFIASPAMHRPSSSQPRHGVARLRCGSDSSSITQRASRSALRLSVVFMKSMMGGTYLQTSGRLSCRKLISMNFMMAGMAR